jgi:hypothetical protein
VKEEREMVRGGCMVDAALPHPVESCIREVEAVEAGAGGSLPPSEKGVATGWGRVHMPEKVSVAVPVPQLALQRSCLVHLPCTGGADAHPPGQSSAVQLWVRDKIEIPCQPQAARRHV